MKKLLILLLFPILMFGQVFSFECITSTSTVTMSGELEDGNSSSAKSNINTNKTIETAPTGFSHDYIRDNEHKHTLSIRNENYTAGFYYTDTFISGSPITLEKGNEIAMPHGSYYASSEDGLGIQNDILQYKPHETNVSFTVPTNGPVILKATSPYILLILGTTGYSNVTLSNEIETVDFNIGQGYHYIYAKEGTYKYTATLENGTNIVKSTTVNGGNYVTLDPNNDPSPDASLGFDDSTINGWFEEDRSPGYYKYLVNGAQTKRGYEQYDVNTEQCYFYSYESNSGYVVKEIVSDQEIYLGYSDSSWKYLYNKVDINNIGAISGEDNDKLNQALSEDWVSRNIGTYKVTSEYIRYYSDEVDQNGNHLQTGYFNENINYEMYLEIISDTEINVYLKNGNCYDGITSTLPTNDEIKNVFDLASNVHEYSTAIYINNYSYDNNGINYEHIYLNRTSVYNENDRCDPTLYISLRQSKYQLEPRTYTYNEGTEDEWTSTWFHHTQIGIQKEFIFEKVNDLNLNYCN